MNSVEIYLRHSGGRALLMFHVSDHIRDTFQDAMQAGVLDGRQAQINFEASVLPEWVTDQDKPQYMRVTIERITVQYYED